MDISEDRLKEEVSYFMSSLQRLLPKKSEISDIIFQPMKSKLTRLSDFHAEAKNVFPKCFIGAKISVLREIMDGVKLSQNYNFGKPKEPYRSFTQMIHKEMEPKTEVEGLVIDSAGSATATYTQELEGSYELRLTSKINDLVSSEMEVTLEKEGENTISSMTCHMKDVDPNSMRIVTQSMYSLTPELSVGTELGFKPLAYPLTSQYAVSAMYLRPEFTLSATISKSGFQVCLFKQFSPDLRIATIVNESVRDYQATVGFGLFKGYKNGSEVRIFVDSQRCGGFTFQKDMIYHDSMNDTRSIRLLGSTLIDGQKRVRFGFGFNLDF